jgi:hypothetical protein
MGHPELCGPPAHNFMSTAPNSVEEIVSQLDANAVGSTPKFDLWVPHFLTFRGKPAHLDVAMALIVDEALGKGYEPDGFTENKGGRIYRFRLLSQ